MMAEEPTIFELNIPYINMPVWFAIILGLIIVIIYFLATRKERPKEYKPIILAKRIRDDLNLHYKYFGERVGLKLMNGSQKAGHVIGRILMAWNEKEMKYEPIQLGEIKNTAEFYKRCEDVASNLFETEFKNLNTKQKEEVRKVVKDELKIETIKTIIPEKNEKITIKGNMKEIETYRPLTLWALKMVPNGFGRILALFMSSKTKYFIFNEEQVEFTTRTVNMKFGAQPTPYFFEVVYSQAGRDLLENTAFKIERENILQETANQIPRTVFFDMEASKRATDRREEAKIESEKFKATREGAQG